MHIQFENLYLKRFRSFQEEATLCFDSAGIGLYFLKGKNLVQTALGSNGSGKSSLLDALMWCLYGKTVQGLKNPDITPWTGKGTTIVEVTIKIDKKIHKIRRTANPNLLTVDGQEVGQVYVDKLIPIPLEIIPYTIIMGQRQPLFFDLVKSEKLKIFAEPLNLERWEARSAHAAELTRSLENEIVAKETECTLLHVQICEIESDIESAKAKRDLWETQRSDALTGKDKDIVVLQKKIAAVQKERDDADLKYDRAETEYRSILTELEKLYREQGTLNQNIHKFQFQLKSEEEKLTEAEDDLKHADDAHCPTCNQSLDNLAKKKLKTELKNAISSYKNGIGVCTDVLDSHADSIRKLDTAIKAQEAAQKQFAKDSNEARDILDKLLPQIAEWEAAIKAIETLKADYENQDNPYKEQFATLRKRKGVIEQSIEQATKAIELKSAYCERVRYWIKGFKDIKLYTLTEILQELEITTNGMLEEFGLVGWRIEYDVERETKSKTIARGLNITVLSPHNKSAVKWEAWSGGEAQRLRIIGSAALSSVLLNHLGVSTNIEVYDEPTESLSKEGVVDLVELLAMRAKDTKKQIWLIDHHTIESSHFADVVTITKGKQGSIINAL